MRFVVVSLLIIIIGLLFIVFHKPKSKIEFQVNNIKSDTIFHNPIWTGASGYGKHISLRAMGVLDSPTEVFVKDPDYSNQFFKVQLPKGSFDTTWVGEYYEKKAEIVFLHRKAQKGSLRIIFRYLTPQKDTLAQSQSFIMISQNLPR